MSPLHRIELDLLQLSGKLSLRPTVETAAEIGRLLDRARPLVPHGEWLPWLRRCGISQQSASDYQAVARHIDGGDYRPAGDLTIKQFLNIVRDARLADRRREREAARQELAERAGELPAGVELHHADCREFGWPDGLDMVATDPPWADLSAYTWLAGMAARQLRPGGLLLVQTGQRFLPAVMGELSAAGLVYQWTLAIVYAQTHTARPVGSWSSGWRPVLVWSRGSPGRLPLTSDTWTVHPGSGAKGGHDWGQPVEPWQRWIERLTAPGAVVADPFAGGGGIGLAAIRAGRRWIGTERDSRAYQVARGRLSP